MAPSTTYSWKVVAHTLNGPVSSPLWSFTTTTRAYTISTLGEVPAPGDLVLDRNGNVYVADQAYCRVRMITPAGIISIATGSGCLPSISPDSGDGVGHRRQPVECERTRHRFQGNLYISSRNRIRKVAPNGVISTFAGSGTFGYSDDGGPAARAPDCSCRRRPPPFPFLMEKPVSGTTRRCSMPQADRRKFRFPGS